MYWHGLRLLKLLNINILSREQPIFIVVMPLSLGIHKIYPIYIPRPASGVVVMTKTSVPLVWHHHGT